MSGADRRSIGTTSTTGSDNTEAGFNFLGGVKNQAGLFFEVKIGVEGSPDLKFGVGYTFR